MTWEIIEPDTEFTWLRLRINGTHDLTLVFTIWGSTRVCLGKKDSNAFDKNWCCGPSILHVWALLNTMLEAIEKKAIDRLPFASDIKPYFRDEKFSKRLEPYYLAKQHFSVIDLQEARIAWKGPDHLTKLQYDGGIRTERADAE